MYIKKAIRERIEYLTRYIDYTNLPKKWNEFIDERKSYLIIKNKDSYKCTCCNKTFKSDKKVNEYEICPNCNRTSLVKSNKLKRYDEKKDLYYIEKTPNGKDYIIRIFELWSYFSLDKMNHSVANWGMIILNEFFFQTETYVSNNFKNNMGSTSIAHYEETEQWKPYYYRLRECGTYYPYNLNNLFGYKYYDLEAMAKKCENMNLPKIVYGANHNSRSLEMLMKAGLYELAYDYKDYDKKGTFKDIFGVDISYLPFMQENNISSNELKMLARFNVKDIEFIKYMASLYRLDELLNYCKPLDLYKYKPNDIYTYIDYLKFANELGYDLKDKKTLYPSNLKEKHDQLSNLCEVKKNKAIQSKIKRRSKCLSKNMFNDKTYIVFPAKSFEELQDEAKQQNNCVKTYAKDYANGKCDIYFMRLVENQSKSLVTVEVKNNKVVQSRIANNYLPSKAELNFLKKWERTILRKCEN